MKNLIVMCVVLLTIISSAVADDNQIRLGAIIPLTGSAAEYGVAVRNGMTLAQEAEPGLFKNLKIIFEDSRYDSKTAVLALKKLQNIDKVNIVVGWGVGPTQAIVPATEKSKLPLIAITADGSVSAGRKYVVRFNYTAQHYAQALMEYLQGCGYKKIGIIEAENSYFQNIVDGMRSSLSAQQSLNVVSSVQMSDADFRSIIPNVQKQNYDAVGVFLVTGQIAAFYQQVAQLKLSAPFFGTDFFESNSEIEKAGRSIDGTVYPSMNISEEFRSRYVARFGNDLQVSYAGNAFDAATLVARSLENIPSPVTPDLLINRLTQKNYSGVSGHYEYVSSPQGGGFDPKLVIKRIDSGKISVASEGDCRK